MSDAPEVTLPSAAPTAKPVESHPLDALTGGAFSAATSGERAARVRDWLAKEPTHEQLQEVFKELSMRDKGAARAIRERLDDIKRAKNQEIIAAEWADKAHNLLCSARLNIADALAWQRDAAKAGAPLSREPLAGLKNQLTERVKIIEDLQHRVQVQREAAVLLAQRIEVLSTKPWADAQAALELLRSDVSRWQEQALQLTSDTNWASVEARFPPLLDASRAQLQVVWDAFEAALTQALAAAADVSAPLPPVPVWADELRAARGLPKEAPAQAASATAKQHKPKVDPVVLEKAQHAVREALVKLEQETAQGHGKASAGAATALRAVLKTQGRYLDATLEQHVHQALLAAGELQGWQRWSADQVREELVAKAEALLLRPEGQALGGRKMQESLRQLREQWKQADQGGPANHGLWRKFDEACNAAHKIVELWLDKVRAEAAEHKAARLALIEEVNTWAAAQSTSNDPNAQPDWKAVNRALHQFAERWRDGGHVGEKVFAELQPQWKQALALASAPLEAAQKESLTRRHAMLDEAAALGAAPQLRIDAIKALQQRWQVEAQSVPLDRKQEQKLWDAFRKPIDEAFNRKSAERERTAVQISARDRAVLEASKALQAANASGNAQHIRAAMQALEAALQSRGETQNLEHNSEHNSEHDSEHNAAVSPDEQAPQAASKPTLPTRPVVAVRGDDRPGMKRQTPAAPTSGRGAGRSNDRKEAHGGYGGNGGNSGAGTTGAARGPRYAQGGASSFEREERGPRLGDTAFRAQRDALEHAQLTLKKLAAQAHGEALTQLLTAWQERDAEKLPSAQELGNRVTAQVRGAWGQALTQAATTSGNPAQALLRLEMAAEVPTPAEQLEARRTLQLQMLTRRNDPTPAQTWGHDAAHVLASDWDATHARRLQSVLKVLLRK